MQLSDPIKVGSVVELRKVAGLKSDLMGVRLKVAILNYNGTKYHSGKAGGMGILFHPNDVKLVKL